MFFNGVILIFILLKNYLELFKIFRKIIKYKIKFINLESNKKTLILLLFFSARQKKLKRNISAGYIQINGFGNASKINMRPKTGKVNHVLALKHIPNNVNRSTLYSKKLFLNSSTLLSQTKSRFFPSLKEKLAEVNKNNSLNYNMKEKNRRFSPNSILFK